MRQVSNIYVRRACCSHRYKKVQKCEKCDDCRSAEGFALKYTRKYQSSGPEPKYQSGHKVDFADGIHEDPHFYNIMIDSQTNYGAKQPNESRHEPMLAGDCRRGGVSFDVLFSNYTVAGWTTETS